MNEQRQALLDALGAARLPGGTIAWPAVLLALLALALLVLLIVVLVRRVRAGRRERQLRLVWADEAQRALARLDEGLDAVGRADAGAQRAWVAEAAELARRVALVIDAREQIAALSGRPWLQRLDALVGRRVFDAEPVAALASLPYRPAAEVPIATRRAIRDALQLLITTAERRSEQPPA